MLTASTVTSASRSTGSTPAPEALIDRRRGLLEISSACRGATVERGCYHCSNRVCVLIARLSELRERSAISCGIEAVVFTLISVIDPSLWFTAGLVTAAMSGMAPVCRCVVVTYSKTLPVTASTDSRVLCIYFSQSTAALATPQISQGLLRGVRSTHAMGSSAWRGRR